MKIISFAWTIEALLAGVKTVTRREWTASYAARFKGGDLIAAYDRSPRYKGHQVAVIRLMQDPYRENIADAPDDDYAAEGLEWMSNQGLMIQGLSPQTFWRAWQMDDLDLWVVRFQLLATQPSTEAYPG